MFANLSIYGGLLLSGLLASLGHCLGMCGPLVMILGLQLGDTGARKPWLRHASYHLARIAVYGILGTIAGGVGSALGLGDRMTALGAGLSLLLGLLVIVLGLSYLGWLPFALFSGGGAWVSKGMGWALKRGGWQAVLLLGALNGLLPCCLVYAALLTASSTGGPVAGALAMVAFGLGTVPALLVVGLGAGLLSQRARQVLTRVAGAVMILVGLQLALRGASALGFVPHLEVRGVVLW